MHHASIKKMSAVFRGLVFFWGAVSIQGVFFQVLCYFEADVFLGAVLFLGLIWGVKTGGKQVS